MKLIFVYNANAGVAAGIMDSVHKTLSPATYDCALCAVTHGIFTMDRQWRAYLKQLPVEAVFYHRPDFREAYPDHAEWALPLVAVERDGSLDILLDAGTLKQVGSADALARLLDERLAAVLDETRS